MGEESIPLFNANRVKAYLEKSRPLIKHSQILLCYLMVALEIG